MHDHSILSNLEEQSMIVDVFVYIKGLVISIS